MDSVNFSLLCASEGLEDLDRILNRLVVDSLPVFTFTVTASRHRYFLLDIVPI